MIIEHTEAAAKLFNACQSKPQRVAGLTVFYVGTLERGTLIQLKSAQENYTNIQHCHSNIMNHIGSEKKKKWRPSPTFYSAENSSADKRIVILSFFFSFHLCELLQ